MVVASPDRLGSTIRSMRLAASLSQRELGERTGFSQPAIARLEAGRQVPTLVTLQRLASAFDSDLVVRIPAVALHTGVSQ
ncbi:MAG: helix-turn-helix domain-containing protein [Acidimicrobiales bacterium]